MSSITMMVRMVMVAATTNAALVTALTMVCWLPRTTLATWPGVTDLRRSMTWSLTSRKCSSPPRAEQRVDEVGEARG